jgi:hypothetical protein
MAGWQLRFVAPLREHLTSTSKPLKACSICPAKPPMKGGR